MVSPCAMNSGTWMTAPVSSVAGLLPRHLAAQPAAAATITPLRCVYASADTRPLGFAVALHATTTSWPASPPPPSPP